MFDKLALHRSVSLIERCIIFCIFNLFLFIFRCEFLFDRNFFFELKIFICRGFLFAVSSFCREFSLPWIAFLPWVSICREFLFVVSSFCRGFDCCHEFFCYVYLCFCLLRFSFNLSKSFLFGQLFFFFMWFSFCFNVTLMDHPRNKICKR